MTFETICKTRETKETKISLKLALNGGAAGGLGADFGKNTAHSATAPAPAEPQISTKIGFFDHMLTALAKHAGLGLALTCEGDTWVDAHHSVEDCGIVLGAALAEAMYPLADVERFGDAVVAMDEAAAACAVDLGGRAFLVFEGELAGKIGEFDAELVEEFFRALAFNARITLHLSLLRGKNAHHKAEAMFKAFAVALRRALAYRACGTPSTKGAI